SDAYLPAMLGLGEVESVLRNDDQALAAYREVVDLIRDGHIDRNVLADRVSDSLMARCSDRFDEGAYHVAGRYAALAERVHGLNDAPPEVLRAMADVALKLAEELLPESEDIRDIQLLDPATKAEAQRFLVRAGSYYRLHADRMILIENEAFLDSLWNAADAFDRAGGQDEAIELFARFTSEAQGDPRRPEAQYRLGRAYQARLQYDEAAAQYQALRDAGSDPTERGVGLWAERARVPLAQCRFRDDDPSNDGSAESLLKEVVEGNSDVGPERTEYEDALLELGRYYYHAGRHEDAMRYLGEARDRLPADHRRVQVAYSLADTNRLSAVAIGEELKEAMPDSTRRDLEDTRTERLKAALSLFEEVRLALEQEDPRRLTALDRVYLRNAMFYMGACAFDLQSYDDAIRAYDAARERYSTDPTSLVALVQIVNAHLAMGDFERARTANERAKRFYESIPDAAWDDPELPMGRADWERWLDSTQKLYDLERNQ
ncbi:MAG: tetratricopeptide repeat protein, partial [Phycisphaerales bacterium]|nr:tetratricopeptide repeat protein [Phycisphaerales bacterium]